MKLNEVKSNLVPIGDLPDGAPFEIDGEQYTVKHRETGGRHGYYAYGVRSGGERPRMIHLSVRVRPL